MATDSQPRLLRLIGDLLDTARSAKWEADLGLAVAKIRKLDSGKAREVAVDLTKLGYSGAADRLTEDVKLLHRRKNEVSRGSYIADPTSDDQKQASRDLAELQRRASHLVDFCEGLKRDLDSGPPAADVGNTSGDTVEPVKNPPPPPDPPKHPWGDDGPEMLLTYQKIADRLDIPGNDGKARENLRKKLDGWRKDNPDGGWIEVADPKPREPKYLFPIGVVWPLVEDRKPSG